MPRGRSARACRSPAGCSATPESAPQRNAPRWCATPGRRQSCFQPPARATDKHPHSELFRECLYSIRRPPNPAHRTALRTCSGAYYFSSTPVPVPSLTAAMLRENCKQRSKLHVLAPKIPRHFQPKHRQYSSATHVRTYCDDLESLSIYRVHRGNLRNTNPDSTVDLNAIL